MTTAEARYVWAHREMYDQATVAYALDILERAGERP